MVCFKGETHRRQIGKLHSLQSWYFYRNGLHGSQPSWAELKFHSYLYIFKFFKVSALQKLLHQVRNCFYLFVATMRLNPMNYKKVPFFLWSTVTQEVNIWKKNELHILVPYYINSKNVY